MQTKPGSSFSCLLLSGPDLNESIRRKSFQSDAAATLKCRRDARLIIPAAAILIAGRHLMWARRGPISLLLQKRRAHSKVLHTKGSHVILQQQCHFLSVGSRREQSEVERRSTQHGVKGHCRVCCTKPVKWSFIFISDCCWWIGLWHKATLQEKVCLSPIWQNQCQRDKSALCCQTSG